MYIIQKGYQRFQVLNTNWFEVKKNIEKKILEHGYRTSLTYTDTTISNMVSLVNWFSDEKNIEKNFLNQRFQNWFSFSGTTRFA